MKKGAGPNNTNNTVHSMYTVARRGLPALPAEFKDRELEAVGNMGTADGIMRELEHSCVSQIMVVECGLAHIRKLIDEGKNPWASGPDGSPEPMLKNWGSYLNGCTRALALLAQLRNDDQVIETDYEAKLEDMKRGIG